MVLASCWRTEASNILGVGKFGPCCALTPILAAVASSTSSVVDRPVARMRLVRVGQRNSCLVGALVLLLIHIDDISNLNSIYYGRPNIFQ